MSYAYPGPVAAPRRPAPVALAAALLALMALVGLGYAVVTLAVTPGVVSRFRAAAAGADPTGVDGYVTAMWVGAGVATVLAVIAFALYVVLALGLRRGSAAARIATWVVCALGLLAGCGSAVAVAVQRTGSGGSAELLAALGSAYPGGWINLNLGLSLAQMLGYVLVAVLLAVAPRAYFRRGGEPAQPAPGHLAHAAPGHPTSGVPVHPTQLVNPYGTAGYHPGSQYGPPATPPPVPGPDDQYWARPT